MSVNFQLNEHAGRYSDLCEALNEASNHWPHLRQSLLDEFVNGRSDPHHHHLIVPRVINPLPNRSGGQCRILTLANDGKGLLPSWLLTWLTNNFGGLVTSWQVQMVQRANGTMAWAPSGAKVSVVWVLCWIYGVVPDQNTPGWETFVLSHRCCTAGLGNAAINQFCLSWHHFRWESTYNNNSRGYHIVTCSLIDHATGQSLCQAYNLHHPHCL